MDIITILIIIAVVIAVRFAWHVVTEQIEVRRTLAYWKQDEIDRRRDIENRCF